MSYELCYTSVPQGLRSGSSGFCTVALTRGTPATLVERLESLSGYRPLFPAGSAAVGQNPVSWAHWRVSAGGKSYSVLSRVCFAGLDYTHRSNKFAHHIALTASEQPAGGPAWAMMDGNVMQSGWSGEPVEYDRQPLIPDGDKLPAPCKAWAAACGDAGWAGALVESFINAPTKPLYVIFPPALNMLPLMAEALALVPRQQRWQVTFNTYHTDAPAGLNCAWRCCAAGSPAAEEARRSGNTVIDLAGRLPPAPDGPWVRFARSGKSDPVESTADASSPPISLGWDGGDVLETRDSRGTSQYGAGRADNPAGAMRSSPVAAPYSADDAYVERTLVPRAITTGARSEPRRNPEARGGAAKWLALAGILSVAVGCIAYFVAQRQAAALIEQANLENRRLVDEAATHANEQADLKRDLTSLKTRFDEQSKKLSEATNPPPVPNPMQLNPDSSTDRPASVALEEANRKIKQQKDQLDAQAAQLRQLHATPTQAAPTPAGPTLIVLQPLAGELRPFEALPSMPQSVFPIGELPPATADGASFTIGSVDGSSAAPHCRLTPLSSLKGPAGDLRYDNKRDTLVRDKASGIGTVDLCSFGVENGNVMMHWLASERQDDDADRRECLKYALLTVENDKGVHEIQFLKPEVIGFNAASAPSVPLPAFAVGKEATLVFSDPSWELDSPGGLKAHSTAAGAIKLTVQNGQILCNYMDALEARSRDLTEKQKAWESALSSLPRKDGELDYKKMQSEGIRNLFEQKSKEFAIAQRNINELQDPKAFPQATVLVRSSNGIVLCAIKLSFRK